MVGLMHAEFVGYKKLNERNYLIRLRWVPGRILRFLGAGPVFKEYVGKVGRWRNRLTGKPCSRRMNTELHAIYLKIRKGVRA